jgi:hypothetical protein
MGRHQSHSTGLTFQQGRFSGFAPSGFVFQVFNKGAKGCCVVGLEAASEVDHPIDIRKDSLAALSKCESGMCSHVLD